VGLWLEHVAPAHNAASIQFSSAFSKTQVFHHFHVITVMLDYTFFIHSMSAASPADDLPEGVSAAQEVLAFLNGTCCVFFIFCIICVFYLLS
jgi:hypothetical protein